MSTDALDLTGHAPREHHPRWKVSLAPRPHEGKSAQQELREGTFKEDALFNTALTLLGIKYGYFRLIELGLRMLLGRTFNPKDAHATPDSLFCSEFVSRCYRNAASGDLLDVNKTANDASTSPSDFATSGFFEKRYQLFDGSNGQACDGLLEMSVGRQKGPRALTWDGTKRLHPATRDGAPENAPPR